MIERIKIPDDDMPGWINTLREGGFSDNEIDTILTNLNKTYANIKNNQYIEKELSKMNEEIEKRRGYSLTDEEKESLKKGIASRIK